MSYVISYLDNPETSRDPEATNWTIEINYIDEHHRESHYDVISVYAKTLDLCLLRAKTLCDILNETNFEVAVATLKGLEDAKNHR